MRSAVDWFFALAFIGLPVLVAPAFAHQAMHAANTPLNWEYPTRCCWGPANGRTGDCGMIPASSVTEGPDGYHVTLRPGDHPLVTEGSKFLINGVLTFVVPYSEAETSQDGAYHICLVPSTLKKRCFFAGSRGY